MPEIIITFIPYLNLNLLESTSSCAVDVFETDTPGVSMSTPYTTTYP